MENAQILNEIEHMNHEELSEILRAVMVRERVLFPDWENVYFSLPKNDLEMRERYLEMMTEYLKGYKK